jgi:hypothetical protein
VGGGADETWAEINIRDEMDIQAGQAFLRLIDPDLAGHAAKDLKEAQVRPLRLRLRSHGAPHGKPGQEGQAG